MEQRVGTCSLCGGDVMGHRGAYWSVIPPPPDHCVSCGAVRADQDPVIPMRRPGSPRRPRHRWRGELVYSPTITATTTTNDCNGISWSHS